MSMEENAVRDKFKEILDSTVIRNYDSPDENNAKIKTFCKKVQELKPKSLFRYRNYNNDTVYAFKNDLVVSSKPADFNDPFDCLIQVDPDDIINEITNPKNRWKLQKWLDYNPKLVEIIPKKNLKRINALLTMKDTTYFNFIQKRMPQFRKHVLQVIKQVKGFLRTYPHIACFSETPTSPPMWAHYADLHKGFVLEYDFKDYFTPCLNCKNTCIFRHYELLYPVIYTKTRFNAKDFFSSYWSHVILMNAPVNVFIPKDDELAIYKTLIHKSKDWEYEKEWRIISHCEAYPMIKQRPIAIYLGAQMEDSNKNHLIQIAKKLKIKRFIMDIDITSPEYKMTPKECKSYRI